MARVSSEIGEVGTYEHLAALAAIVESPAWPALKAEIQDRIEAAIKAVRDAQSEFVLARASGELAALSRLASMLRRVPEKAASEYQVKRAESPRQ